MAIYLKNVNPTILGNADPTIEVVQSLTVGSKIGIGTAAPTDKLQLDSTGGANFRITNTTNSRYALFGLDSTGSFVKNSNNGNTFRLINANGLAAFTADYSTEGFTFVGATNSLLRAYAPSVARFIFQNDARSYSISTESTNFHVVDQTASATRMTMNSSGHVCFGSGAPRSLLDLGVDGSALVIGGAGSGGQLRFGANADANSIQYYDSEFAFRTNQSNGHRFYVNGEKRLEIGGSSNSSNERKVTIYGRFQLTNGSSTGMYFNVSENENQAFIGREGGAGSRLGLYYNGWKFRVDSDNAVFSTDVVMDSQRIYLMPNKEVSTDYTGGIAWSSVYSSYGIFKSSGGWSHPYPDLRIAFHTGIQIGGHFGYGGTRFYNNSDMATEIFSVGNGDNLVRVAQGLLVTSGNVGIGTTSALAALDMGSGGIRLGGVIRTSWPAGAEAWVAAGSNIYYNTGNVGIGTTSPGNKLSVNTPVAASEASVFITQAGSYNGKGLLVRRSAVAGVVAPVFAVEDSAGNNYFKVDADGSFSGQNGSSSNFFTIGQGGGGPYLKLNFNGGTKHYRLGTDDTQFYVYDEAAASRRFVISAATGNVGIGTTSPAATLDVVGTAKINGLNIGYLNIPQTGSAKTASYSLVVGDVGKFVELGAGGTIVVPASVFAAGDVVSIVNNTTGTIACTCSAIALVYKGGTDVDISSFSIATRGIATLFFVNATTAVVTGNLV